MIEFNSTSELENKLYVVLDIWGICNNNLINPSNLAKLITARIDLEHLNDEKVIKKNIEDIILEYLKDKKEYLLDLDIIIKLIFEDKYNYLNILKSYNVLDNLINYYNYPLLKDILSHINDETTICIFSSLYLAKPNFKYMIWHTNILTEKLIRPKIYDLTREYFVNGEYNKIENIYLTLSNDQGLTKLVALKFARYLNMKEFYYRDKYEEGIINVNSGVLTPKKNKGIVIENNNVTLLQGFTSIDVFEDYDRSTYKVYSSNKYINNIVDFDDNSNSNRISYNKRRRINKMIQNAYFYK